MTITEMFDMFLAGRQLPSLAANQARSLLDLCRSKLLSRGIKTAESGDLKRDLLEAHRQLTGGGVYATANTHPLGNLTEKQVAEMLSEHKRTGTPLLELFAGLQGGTVKPAAAARPAAPTRPAPAATPAPAPGSFATRLTAANAREIAAAVVDEAERRHIASLTKTRRELASMTPREAGQFFKNGGKLTD
jgi:hypothetical protein